MREYATTDAHMKRVRENHFLFTRGDANAAIPKELDACDDTKPYIPPHLFPTRWIIPSSEGSWQGRSRSTIFFITTETWSVITISSRTKSNTIHTFSRYRSTRRYTITR